MSLICFLFFLYFQPDFSENVDDKNASIDSIEYSDTDDIIVEEEKIIYLNDLNDGNIDRANDIIESYQNLDMKMLNFCLTDNDVDDNDVVIEEENIVYTQRHNDRSAASSNVQSGDSGVNGSTNGEPITRINNVFKEISNFLTSSNKDDDDSNAKQAIAIEKLRYKRKYSKIDPNILIEFAQKECTLKSLKILFDWLKVNNEILVNCFSSNPEFVHKIMKLLNYFNIDIFTRKVCFDRNLIKTENVRNDLRTLFDIRISVPLHEDILLKDFAVLESVQQNLDFEIPLQMGVTENEENILRIFKLVDFGFFICKTKKYRYNFCARSRRFIEISLNGRKDGGGTTGNVGNGSGGGGGRRDNRQRRSERRRGFIKRKNESGRRGKRMKQRNSYTSNEENDFGGSGGGGGGGGGIDSSNQEDTQITLPKKSYLKNRNHAATKTVEEKENQLNEGGNGVGGTENKYEIMGKLWLRNEVKTLESKVSKKPTNNFTPYLVMDAKSLTDYASIVKNLIKTKKFVVLIPNAGMLFKKNCTSYFFC